MSASWDEIRTRRSFVCPKMRASFDAQSRDMYDVLYTLLVTAQVDRYDEVERLVRRDRNHPSVIIWSLCNEKMCNLGIQGGVAEFSRRGTIAKNIFKHWDPLGQFERTCVGVHLFRRGVQQTISTPPFLGVAACCSLYSADNCFADDVIAFKGRGLFRRIHTILAS